MNALAACRFRLGYTSLDGKAGTLDVKPIEKFEAWTVNEGGQPVLWASDLILGDAFFNDLIKHAAPLSGKAIRDLSGSALALDWYGLLAYRLHSLEKPIFVSWDQMRDQMENGKGPGFTRVFQFSGPLHPFFSLIRLAFRLICGE